MWARFKEATKRGKQKWKRGAARRPRLLAKHPCRKDSSTGGGELGQARKKRRWGRWATGMSKRSSDPRALGIGSSSLCFLSVFSKCVLSLVRASLVWARFISLVLSQCAQFVGGGGVGVADLRADGRQELDKIVCRHSLLADLTNLRTALKPCAPVSHAGGGIGSAL